MPIEYAPQFTKKYNKTAICEALGVTVPDGYVAIEEQSKRYRANHKYTERWQ